MCRWIVSGQMSCELVSFVAPADSEDDPGYAFELFYKFQVTDNITVTPALTYLSKPYSNAPADNEISALSGLVKTTFKF